MAREIIVDDERFEVTERPDAPGQLDFAWLSGPNAGYGFSSTRSDAAPPSKEELHELVRTFLRQVNPATGFID